MLKTSLAVVVTLAALGACSKNTDTASTQESATGTESTKTVADPVEPAKPVVAAKSWLPIPELGIQVEVPGTPTHELVLTDVYAVTASDCDFQIGKAYEGDDYYETTLKTLEKNYARITVEEFSKKERNADGSFSIEARLKTKNGAMWYVQNRVKIDDTPFTIFSCSSEEMKSESHAACVSHACATAKKL